VLLDAALAACAEEGAQVEKITLAGMEIRDCVGCVPCFEKCVTGDTTWEVTDRLLDADGIILASPTYQGMMSGLLKSFLDRAIYIGRKHRAPSKVAGHSGLLKDKVGASIAVGASSGMQFVNLEHVMWFLKNQMLVATGERSLYLGLAATARDRGEVKCDKVAMEGARELGRRMVELIRLTGTG